MNLPTQVTPLARARKDHPVMLAGKWWRMVGKQGRLVTLEHEGRKKVFRANTRVRVLRNGKAT